MLIGYYYYALEGAADSLAKWGPSLLLGGGFGFLTMLFIAGTFQVPRRYSDYNEIPLNGIRDTSAMTATLGGDFCHFHRYCDDLVYSGLCTSTPKFTEHRCREREIGG